MGSSFIYFIIYYYYIIIKVKFGVMDFVNLYVELSYKKNYDLNVFGLCFGFFIYVESKVYYVF